MSNCVFSYVTDCRRGESFIYHVDDGTELGATVELNEYYQVVQAMNYDNVHSDKAHAIMESYVKPYWNGETSP